MTDPEATEQVLRAWDSVSAGWERNRERVFNGFRGASEWLVDQVDPQPGETVLDLAAGPGETGFLARERLGAEGRLISTDLSPGMVAASQRGAEARGLTNVECRVLDAQRMDLPDASIDAVISRLGLMLMPDPGQALREVRRVLRPGGRVAYAVIGAPDRNPWVGVMVMAFVSRGHAPGGGDPFDAGGPFSLSGPGRNRELVAAAGFDEIEVTELAGTMPFDGPDDYWSYQLAIAGPLAELAGSLPSDELEEIRVSLGPSMEPFKSGDTYKLPSHLVGVSAR